MAGQFKFNFYSPGMTINTCSHDGSACGSKITMAAPPGGSVADEERGEQGVSIGMKKILARAEGLGKRNAILWETNRTLDGQGQGINGSGTGALLNDIHTSDGVDLDGDGIEDNNFGVRARRRAIAT